MKKMDKPRYVLKWENKLEIGDASVQCFDKTTDTAHVDTLVVSYKSIHVNSYTVFVIDIDSGRLKFKHENYQLWESPVIGFLNTFSNDYVILNKEGTSFVPLGKQEKRAIDNPDGTERMVHSLPSCCYLEIDDSNFLSFERPNQGSLNRLVKIQEQQLDNYGNTYYDEIYSVNMDEMSLSQLIVIQSLFMSDSAMDVIELIKMQPDPMLFFKSYMELDQSNMIQIFSFDSRIIKTLMDFEFTDYNRKNPVFYKMRHNIDGEVILLSALDVALENNQIRALNLIIQYIVEF